MTLLDDTAIIAKQQRELESLKERIRLAVASLQNAHLRMIGIGGPLNDDRLKCSSDQRREFWHVNEGVEIALSALESEGE